MSCPCASSDSYCLVKKLTPTARLPEYAHLGDIGADLFSDEDKVIEKGKRSLVGTGICIEPDMQFKGYVRIAPRSGLAVKGIDVGAGVVDIGYRNELKILIINNSDADFVVTHGMKIAQAIFEKAERFLFTGVAELSGTERGQKGFGSSGV